VSVALTGSGSSPDKSARERGSRSGLIVLGVLTGINLLNYLDRYVVSALLPDLKRAPLYLSDFQLGTLMSGFLVVYTLAAPIFGRVGDRSSRTRPIAIGVFLWSLATGLSGLARNYFQLLGGRAAVGIGEAAYVTIASSLLADYFPRSTRGRAFAIFNMAIPVGAALGYIVGGVVRAHYGWRAAFYVAGVPGILLAAWMFRLPDPPRGAQDPAPAGIPAAAATQRSWWAVYLTLLRQRPYMLTVLGYAAYTFALGGLAFWTPTFLERVRGISALQASAGFGEIVVVTGFVGTFVGGWLGDYWLKYSRQAYLWMSAAITLLAVPVVYVALAAASPSVFYPALIAAELLLFMSTGPINTAIVNLVDPLERASAVALSVLAIHLLGDVFSPSLIGVLSDVSSLGSAVMIVPVAVAVSAALWFFAAKAAAVNG
jgi:MFS transporter, Spinster family, sphingosine-1-phosphate transporter